MKISEKWLREWVSPDLDTQALAHQITMAGLEVDGVEPVSGAFTGVVVGEVVECGQHPNADKLRVTKVNVGGDRLLGILIKFDSECPISESCPFKSTIFVLSSSI